VLFFSTEKYCLVSDLADRTAFGMTTPVTPDRINEGEFWEYTCTDANTYINSGPAKSAGPINIECPNDLTTYTYDDNIACVAEMECEVEAAQMPNAGEGVNWFQAPAPELNDLFVSTSVIK